MTSTTKDKQLHNVLAEIKQRDEIQIGRAEAALFNLGVDESVVAGFRSITGVRHPLSLPTAADAGARRDLAQRLASRIGDDFDFGAGPTYAAFEITNPNWRCPMQRPRIPLRTMEQDTLPRLKRRRGVEIVYAPTVKILAIEGTRIIQPRVRFMAYGFGLDEGDAGFIDSVRRDLGAACNAQFTPLQFKPLTRDKLAARIGHMVELTPVRARGSRNLSAEATQAAETDALVRMMLNATLPMKAIAGGTGGASEAVSGATAEWKATLRKPKRVVLASNEVPSLLSEIPVHANGQRVRLPYWATE